MWLQADRWMIGIQSDQLLSSLYTVIHLSLFRSKFVCRHFNIGATLGLAPLPPVILTPAQFASFGSCESDLPKSFDPLGVGLYAQG